ncbi:MAG: hypothetical protein IT355_12040 [Gemmatimonadaceae bacterium]|nr:hypothetical protein [Gemmatimonadaceae bacterium]
MSQPAEKTFTGQQPISASDLQTTRMSTKVKQFRETVLVFDEFRREWTVILDTVSKGIVDVVSSVPAPVSVPIQYMSIPRLTPWRLVIDWRRYVGELRRAMLEWERRVLEHMKALYKEQADGMAPTSTALALAGMPPQDWRIAAFAAKGDPWALGLQPQRTQRVVAILGTEPWVKPTGRPIDDDNFGLDEALSGTFQRGRSDLVPSGFADEAERRPRVSVPRRAAAASKTAVLQPVAAPVAETATLDLAEFEDDDEGIDEETVRRAAADLAGDDDDVDG